MDNKKYLIWYHSEDNDGVFSAAIIYVYLNKVLHVNPDSITLEGMTYNTFKEQYPNIDSIEKLANIYTNIIMTDVSFNDYRNMKALKNTFGNSFVWIDHHKPIIDMSFAEQFDDVEGWRDISRSAILNAYRFLFDPLDEKYQSGNAPELLRILSAYDSWTYENEKIKFDKCRNVNKAVTIYFDLDIKKVIPFVDELLSRHINTVVDIEGTKFIRQMNKMGKTLNDYDDILVKNQLKNHGDFNWTVNGQRAVMIMFQGPTSSTMFKTLQKTDYKNGIVLKYLPNGNWSVSLYNIEHGFDKQFHCGTYLNKHYGGGGHAGAAGAILSPKMFNKVMKNKTL